MNQKTIVIIAVVVLVAFLLGFVPQYWKSRDLENQLATNREKLQMDELGLMIGYVYLQTNQKNYGLARQYSTKFFDRVRAVSSVTRDSNRKNLLESMLVKRDDVTGGLAKGDPGTVTAVQDLFQRTLEATAAEWK